MDILGLIKLGEAEKKICDNFYNKVRETLVKAYNYKEEEADFETYRYFLQNTTKPPKDYMNIFYCIPEHARKAILKHLGYRTEKQFKKSFAKQLNVYRQSAFRREEKEDIDTDGRIDNVMDQKMKSVKNRK